MKIKQLIEKYQIQLDTVKGVIETSDNNEDTLTAQAVERFLKGFIKDLEELQSMDVKLALKINKLVHNECKDVPHDIGIRIEELVRLYQNELKKYSIPDKFGHNNNWKYCPGCGKKWKKDSESFGCWSCGFIM